MKTRIKKIIDFEQVTASKFADIIGVQRSSVSHILSGRNNPSLEVIQKILSAFSNLNTDWLILGEGQMFKNPNLQQQTFFTEPEIMLQNSSVSKENMSTIDIHKTENVFKINENQEYEKSEKDEKQIHKDETKLKSTEKIIIFNSDRTFIEYSPSK
jgi:transcriptional regulator with XRE-family HTH domain